MKNSIDLPISNIQRIHATVKVTGYRRFRLRLWLGVKILALGAWVLPVNASVEVGE